MSYATTSVTGTTSLFGVMPEMTSIDQTEGIIGGRAESEWRDIAKELQSRANAESKRHDELLGKLDKLIDLYQVQQLQQHPQPQVQTASQMSRTQPRSISPRRSPMATPIEVSPPRRHRSRDRVRVRLSPAQKAVLRPTSPVQRQTRTRKKKTRTKNMPHNPFNLPSDPEVLLNMVSQMEGTVRNLRRDKQELLSEKDVLTSENVYYRERLQEADASLAKVKRLKNQVRALGVLQVKGSDIQDKRTTAINRLEDSISKLNDKWAASVEQSRASLRPALRSCSRSQHW
eukprot:TRINITY_DN15356_c0_g1_i1.p1 TRINITY_DN15356_c0_g1~~TRINITY_DN15356_c0_g1_i1.p1  ORF type:complete len:287 (+),score=41.89 TRINITY_DN15356_c0_g1_i1:143-1003(+)